jgi:hypothetical protein
MTAALRHEFVERRSQIDVVLESAVLELPSRYALGDIETPAEANEPVEVLSGTWMVCPDPEVAGNTAGKQQLGGKGTRSLLNCDGHAAVEYVNCSQGMAGIDEQMAKFVCKGDSSPAIAAKLDSGAVPGTAPVEQHGWSVEISPNGQTFKRSGLNLFKIDLYANIFH